MRKKIQLIYIFILVLSLLLYACGSRTPNKKVDVDVPDVSDVTILETSRNNETITHVFSKGVTFKVDKVHFNEIDYISGKKDQSLKLEDGNGVVWILELPYDALLDDVHISITSLTDIKSGDLGALSGGVLFEPDGLQFSSPAKLTVTGKSIDRKCVLLTGDNEGKNIDFINIIANDKGASAELEHFSTVYAAPSSSDSIMVKHAKESLDEAYAEAKKLLKQPLDFPAPPAISLKCNHSGRDDSQKIIDKYVEQFKQPEQDIRSKIISAQHTLSQIDKNSEPDWSIIDRLSYRLVKKSVKLIKSFSPQPDYFRASSAAVDSVGVSYAETPNNTGTDFLIQMLAEWARKITDKFLEELINKHDYEKIHPILNMGRKATLLSSGQVNNYLKLLSDALQFRIEYENIVNFETENPMGFSTEGRIPLNLAPDGIVADVKSNMGTGSGKYTGFISPDPQVGLVRPNTYNINGQVINFLPCTYDNFDILIDMFGAKKEIMTAKGQSVSVDGMVHRIGIGAFGNKLATNPLPQLDGNGNVLNTVFYKFQLDIHNMNEIAGEKTFKVNIAGNTVELTLKLVHTPNGKGPSKGKDSDKNPFSGKSPTKGDDGDKGSDGGDGSEGNNGTGDVSASESGGTGGDGDYKETDSKDNQSGNGGLLITRGKLPDDFPKELVPLPDDARIITGSGDASSGWTVVYTTAAKISVATDFVKNYMKSAEDYRVSDLGTGISIAGVKSNQQIAVLIINNGGFTMVSIGITRI